MLTKGRSISGISKFLYPLEETVRNKFIPAITGGYICSNNERRLLSLPTHYCGLAMPLFYKLAETEFENSRKITSELTPLIINQSSQYIISERKAKQLKQDMKRITENNCKSFLQELNVQMNEKEKRLVKISTEKGISNWLTMLPITEHTFELSKQQFWDSVRLPYGWEIANLPTFCQCGSKFDIEHSMSCKKGGFVSIWHNNLRNLTARIVLKVCKETEMEPILLPLSGEELHGRTTNWSKEARLDIRAWGFWNRGQKAFFDIRVFDPNACRYLNKSLQQCHATSKHEKKRLYNKRVLQVDHGRVTPLVFSIYSSMGRECNMFYSRLFQLISDKRNLSKSITMNWIRTKVCFELLELSLLCLWGSRTVSRKVSEFECDIDVSIEHAKIWII